MAKHAGADVTFPKSAVVDVQLDMKDYMVAKTVGAVQYLLWNRANDGLAWSVTRSTSDIGAVACLPGRTLAIKVTINGTVC